MDKPITAVSEPSTLMELLDILDKTTHSLVDIVNVYLENTSPIRRDLPQATDATPQAVFHHNSIVLDRTQAVIDQVTRLREEVSLANSHLAL